MGVVIEAYSRLASVGAHDIRCAPDRHRNGFRPEHFRQPPGRRMASRGFRQFHPGLFDGGLIDFW
ncbi:hypothetical protein [Actinoplanes xinjiangensis]|uniref:Uncharacterized protein n=1 Tax=Actinoplanes xinjiangensis TaxID=512350 RepID=A0A316FH86_9ACTN|nr:hypothetical protein [Actinoplanes xinjiangensis]PWK48311.1 hypothetical protein BC793_106341 [Actinoplanes xinjiangensis]GIF38934.1 hypothetical protein Axi01nite_32450 [Actinoplanes xinjiangensis]